MLGRRESLQERLRLNCGALRYLAPTGKWLPILVRLGSRLVDANELGYFLVRIQVGAWSGAYDPLPSGRCRKRKCIRIAT